MVRCKFCHEWIPKSEYPSHQAAHRRLLPDGQQRDYASLPPEDRYSGQLADAPRVYLHLGCGGQTVMQEAIIRT